MAHSRLFERTVYPIALLIKVTPIVAIAPLFVIWFGFGSFPKMMIAALITFFPVMVNTFIGLRSVNATTLDFFRLLDASEAQVLIKLRIPGALPYVFAAFRIAVPLSVIGAVVGEWFTGDRGLGSVIIVAHHNIDMPTLFSAIAILACIGLGLTGITALIERPCPLLARLAAVRPCPVVSCFGTSPKQISPREYPLSRSRERARVRV